MRRCLRCRAVCESKYAASCPQDRAGSKGCAGELVPMSPREIDAYESQPVGVENRYEHPFFHSKFSDADMVDLRRLCRNI